MRRINRYAMMLLGLTLSMTSCQKPAQHQERGRIYDRAGVLLVDNAENAPAGRAMRVYPGGVMATHVLGSVGRDGGEFGIERSYNNALKAGKDVVTTIDAGTQALAESLMLDKVGALVAIEPRTGEVLSMVSAPWYNPVCMVDSLRNESFPVLRDDPDKPFFNRAIAGYYPPASTFKPALALCYLQDGVITSETKLSCDNGFQKDGWRMGCHDGHVQWMLKEAQATSCNGYFGWGIYNYLTSERFANPNVAMDRWAEQLHTMGFGAMLNIDLIGEGRGFVPDAAYMQKLYHQEDWDPIHACSEGIGQGAVVASPLQLANLAATIANHGYYLTPHVAKTVDGKPLDGFDPMEERHYTLVDSCHYKTVAEGMREAVLHGTVARTGNLDAEGIAVCGATGTAQNSKGKDHSVYIAFAPMDNPQIAVCCYVEHGGFGAIGAAPIATAVMKHYLKNNR